MKTRNGFVSNSSTSSFIVVCKKADWDAAKKALGPGKMVIDSVLGKPEIKTLYGEPHVFSFVTSSTEDRYYDISDDDTRKIAENENVSCDDIYEIADGVIGKFFKDIQARGGLATEEE